MSDKVRKVISHFYKDARIASSNSPSFIFQEDENNFNVSYITVFGPIDSDVYGLAIRTMLVIDKDQGLLKPPKLYSLEEIIHVNFSDKSVHLHDNIVGYNICLSVLHQNDEFQQFTNPDEKLDERYRPTLSIHVIAESLASVLKFKEHNFQSVESPVHNRLRNESEEEYKKQFRASMLRATKTALKALKKSD